jgi:hypothetical protein
MHKKQPHIHNKWLGLACVRQLGDIYRLLPDIMK